MLQTVVVVSSLFLFVSIQGQEVKLLRGESVAAAVDNSIARLQERIHSRLSQSFLTAVSAKAPSAAPLKAPSAAPLKAPSAAPLKAPSAAPLKPPSAAPLKAPSAAPLKAPSAQTSITPTASPVVGGGAMGDLIVTQSWASSATCAGAPIVVYQFLNQCIYSWNAAKPYVKYVKTSSSSYNETYYSDSACKKSIAGSSYSSPLLTSCYGGSTFSMKSSYYANASAAASLLPSYGHLSWLQQGYFTGSCALSGEGEVSAYAFPMNVCLGGAIYSDCTGTGYSLKSFSNPTNCTGTYTTYHLDSPSCHIDTVSKYNIGQVCSNL